MRSWTPRRPSASLEHRLGWDRAIGPTTPPIPRFSPAWRLTPVLAGLVLSLGLLRHGEQTLPVLAGTNVLTLAVTNVPWVSLVKSAPAGEATAGLLIPETGLPPTLEHNVWFLRRSVAFPGRD